MEALDKFIDWIGANWRPFTYGAIAGFMLAVIL